MLRILLINDTAKKVGRLKTALTEAGFEVIDESGYGAGGGGAAAWHAGCDGCHARAVAGRRPE